MGFQTPMYTLSQYLEETRSGRIQLPDFQRGYKWDDERIRQLLITVLRGHPMGVVMLLETNNALVRFKPRPIAGVELKPGTEPEKLLLDGQQRLTSLTQALTEDGVVQTKDVRGKLLGGAIRPHGECPRRTSTAWTRQSGQFRRRRDQDKFRPRRSPRSEHP